MSKKGQVSLYVSLHGIDCDLLSLDCQRMWHIILPFVTFKHCNE